MESGYDLLISKINEFTRKFYLNKLIRGSIYSASIITAFYLFLFTGIYYTNPGVITKTFLFFSFLIISFTAIFIGIIKPGMALFKLSKHLSLDEAAILIGNHFFTIKDKLINALQLKSLADQSPNNRSLILASIDQKIAALQPIPFTNAIRLTENRKYAKYILIPLSFILFIAFLAPSILKEGTTSFVQYNKEILPVAPFKFELLNANIIVIQGDDVTLKLKLNGSDLPQDVYLNEGENSYKLEKQDISHFSYTFKNLQKSKGLRFSAGGFNSSSYLINVKPRPSILNTSATLNYPAYLLKKNESIENVNDLLIPEGTRITWKIETEYSRELHFTLGKSPHKLPVKDGRSEFNSLILKNTEYQISAQNAFINNTDSIFHQITVIPDQFPAISINEKTDSLSNKALYFTGNATDDHGFSSLKFCYEIENKGQPKRLSKKAIPIKQNQTENTFFYFWDLKNINIKAGQSLTYYFEVADNDGINGPKLTRSPSKIYMSPTTQQVSQKLDEGNQQLKKQMETAIQLAAAVEKESKKLGESFLNKTQMSFDDKKKIDDLLSKQNQLEELVKEIKKQNEKNNFEKEENNILREELKDKQKQLDDLFNKVLDDKTKALLEKFQALMNQNDKDQTKDALSKMQLDNKSLKSELDRLLELYKQLEFEQDLKDKASRLNDLANEQKELSKQSTSQKSTVSDLKNQQDKLSKDFKQLKKELKNLNDKNQQLERPNTFKTPEAETKNIEQQQKASMDQLSQENKSKAAESQQKAGAQMEQLAAKLEEMQQESIEKENNLNVEELRKLLGNLVATSFEQEKVILSLKQTRNNDQLYIADVQKQQVIKSNMQTIGDSLFSLSKRIPQIESAVNGEMGKININLGKSLEYLGSHQIENAGRDQQNTMTSINNLAVMLNEALEQLQKMKKNAKGGGKGKKGNMQQLQQMQQQLNNSMQKAKDQMEKNGNKGTASKGVESEDFAKMSQQQQMIRSAIQKINREDNKDGTGRMGNLNQMVKDMKLTETELINKRIEQESINRQKELLTKLLEADQAEREQDQDSKRESKAAKDFPPSYHQLLQKFKKEQQNETEMLQKMPPTLNYYYKNRINEYFKLLNSAR